MTRRNRVDPFGDLHAVPERGMFTGNRGCLVDESGVLARHHRGNLWIACVTRYKDWRSPLDRPGRWTPLFFLDDAVALAAGHRPCGLCRRDDYLAYRAAVSSAVGQDMDATTLNRRLAGERLRRGGGLVRGSDRKLWIGDAGQLPDGTVAVIDGGPRLLLGDRSLVFTFAGWTGQSLRPDGLVSVLTPPTSVLALAHGFRPTLHPGVVHRESA